MHFLRLTQPARVAAQETEMPAKSKKQQQFFGMVEAGKIEKPSGMSKQDVKDFASTSTKKLPTRVPKKK